MKKINSKNKFKKAGDGLKLFLAGMLVIGLFSIGCGGDDGGGGDNIDGNVIKASGYMIDDTPGLDGLSKYVLSYNSDGSLKETAAYSKTGQKMSYEIYNDWMSDLPNLPVKSGESYLSLSILGIPGMADELLATVAMTYTGNNLIRVENTLESSIYSALYGMPIGTIYGYSDHTYTGSNIATTVTYTPLSASGVPPYTIKKATEITYHYDVVNNRRSGSTKTDYGFSGAPTIVTEYAREYNGDGTIKKSVGTVKDAATSTVLGYTTFTFYYKAGLPTYGMDLYPF